MHTNANSAAPCWGVSSAAEQRQEEEKEEKEEDERVTIIVESAQHICRPHERAILDPKKLTSELDPYVVIGVGGSACRTAVNKRGGRHPVFPPDARASFALRPDDKLFTLLIMNAVEGGEDEILGKAKGDLLAARQLGADRLLLPIMTSKREQHGIVCVSVEVARSPLRSTEHRVDSLAPLDLQALHCPCHDARAAGTDMPSRTVSSATAMSPGSTLTSPASTAWSLDLGTGHTAHDGIHDDGGAKAWTGSAPPAAAPWNGLLGAACINKAVSAGDNSSDAVLTMIRRFMTMPRPAEQLTCTSAAPGSASGRPRPATGAATATAPAGVGAAKPLAAAVAVNTLGTQFLRSFRDSSWQHGCTAAEVATSGGAVLAPAPVLPPAAALPVPFASPHAMAHGTFSLFAATAMAKSKQPGPFAAPAGPFGGGVAQLVAPTPLAPAPYEEEVEELAEGVGLQPTISEFAAGTYARLQLEIQQEREEARAATAAAAAAVAAEAAEAAEPRRAGDLLASSPTLGGDGPRMQTVSSS